MQSIYCNKRRSFKVLKITTNTLLIIFGFLLFSACGSGYQEKDGKITFNGMEISDKSLIVLNDVFAKSDTAVWYKEYSMEGADIATFSALDEHYAKDKITVFYCDEERDGQSYYLTKNSVIMLVKGADAPTFSTLTDGYAKDKRQGYFEGVGFEVKDAATLEVMEGLFVKDKYQVYFNRVPVKTADVQTFRIINSTYAKDTSSIYVYGKESDLNNGIYKISCDANSFSPLQYPFSKDKASAFYVYSKITHSDTETFEVVGSVYSKDKNHVYIETKILEGADPASFTMVKQDENSVEENNYTKDNNHIFWKGKKLIEANVTSFKVLGQDYATDGKKVYYQSIWIKNADPASFTIAQHGFGDWDAEDMNNKFLKGKRVVE